LSDPFKAGWQLFQQINEKNGVIPAFVVFLQEKKILLIIVE
jgi:hypothetical protein